MKKLLTAMSLILGLGLATAQQTTPATATKTVQQAPKTLKAQEAPKTLKATETKSAATSNGMKMKKDGTPDKRYKANKHLKKDGTPDKRYKANK
ncbi:hypothetical protein ACNFU2_15500 [Chryseobacterium sp. PTM-20240506]|uniref:hypothetical protein n=1 Tax=unclassified Chryseobacterium TaxID=2593645 RepID=UPI0023590D8A|nr:MULTISPECIES: hypothetical protein [unclassified Chryseobacterium]MDC8106294.1 hypothetical protein [Chryseobacterium sp. B21-037]MDQ1804800.1 hypothetical protein [Chryseobacterium sp. CKR4-1]